MTGKSRFFVPFPPKYPQVPGLQSNYSEFSVFLMENHMENLRGVFFQGSVISRNAPRRVQLLCWAWQRSDCCGRVSLRTFVSQTWGCGAVLEVAARRGEWAGGFC